MEQTKIEILFDYRNGQMDAVSIHPVNIGDEVIISYANNVPVIKNINKIIEQRKEKGLYLNEDDRRNWVRFITY